MYNLNDFGLTYKTGSPVSLWRFNALVFGGGKGYTEQKNDSIIFRTNQFRIQVSVGKEHRTIIGENFEFRIGGDVSFSYEYLENGYDDMSVNNDDHNYITSSITPGIRLVLGMNFILKEHLVLGAEVLPRFSYSFTKLHDDVSSDDQKRDGGHFSYGFSSNSVKITIAYRFN